MNQWNWHVQTLPLKILNPHPRKPEPTLSWGWSPDFWSDHQRWKSWNKSHDCTCPWKGHPRNPWKKTNLNHWTWDKQPWREWRYRTSLIVFFRQTGWKRCSFPCGLWVQPMTLCRRTLLKNTTLKLSVRARNFQSPLPTAVQLHRSSRWRRLSRWPWGTSVKHVPSQYLLFRSMMPLWASLGWPRRTQWWTFAQMWWKGAQLQVSYLYQRHDPAKTLSQWNSTLSQENRLVMNWERANRAFWPGSLERRLRTT